MLHMCVYILNSMYTFHTLYGLISTLHHIFMWTMVSTDLLVITSSLDIILVIFGFTG